jgi:hypothetical protein
MWRAGRIVLVRYLADDFSALILLDAVPRTRMERGRRVTLH